MSGKRNVSKTPDKTKYSLNLSVRALAQYYNNVIRLLISQNCRQ